MADERVVQRFEEQLRDSHVSRAVQVCGQSICRRDPQRRRGPAPSGVA
jgi:hypothetical protein